MPKSLRSSGFLFAAIFMAGYFVNLVFIGMRDGILHAFTSPTQLSLLAASGLFVVSALVDRFRWIQPAMFIGLSPVSIISEPEGIYGLGFFIMGMILLERAGFFIKRRLLKVLITLVYLLVIEVVAVALSKRPLQDAISPTFFIAAFGVFLWFIYKDRLSVLLREPKPILSLVEKGLSPTESSFVLQTLAGRSQKEIAMELELKESTIRNTLARAYKKLEVEDRVGLAILGERFEIHG